MRRAFTTVFILFCLTSLACQTLFPQATATPIPTATPPSTTPLPPTTAPTPVETPPSQFTPTPSSSAGFMVRYHPDGGLYAGDRVSFEIIAPPGVEVKDSSLQVELENPLSTTIAQGTFSAYGIGQRMQATLYWAWETRDLLPGEYVLRFTVIPQNIRWEETVSLQSSEDRPLAEQQATWEEATSTCCVVYSISHTAAERDLPQLLEILDTQARDASQRMGIEFSQPITITLLPRVLGHGGFANAEISASYLDRNYADGQLGLIIHHEMVHILDAHLGGELRPSVLVEGLAVYLTGGHYKPEPLMPRAAALLPTWGNPPQPGLDRYIPLATLADDFYHAQHEIGYLEGSSLIEYMVQTWGWEAFSAFYRDIHPQSSDSQAQAMDAALQQHFGLSLEQLEQNFLAALRSLPASESLIQDVRLTIAYYDTLRRYQQMLDPSAYFLTAWLPDNPTMRKLGITADYVRHPRGASNLALETLFVNASEAMQASSYDQVETDLAAINRVLDAIEQGTPDPFSADDLAAEYFRIMQILLTDPEISPDNEPQRLEIHDKTARVWVSDPQARLFELTLFKDETGWRVQTPVPTSVP